MDAEQLKLILDTVRSVADTAGMAGIVWICIHYAVQLAQVLAVPACLVMCIWIASRNATKWTVAKEQKADANEVERTKRAQLEYDKAMLEAKAKHAVVQLCAIARAAGVKHSEYSGIYSTSDLESIIQKVEA